MSSTYSPDLRIELIGTGDQAGVWGATTNNNLAYVLEQAVAGYVSVSVASANQALTYLNGATSVAADNQSVHASLALTTSTGANFAVYAPPNSKQYTIYNASSFTATIYNSTVIGNTTAAGTGVAIPAGKTMTVWSDGTNFTQQNTHLNSPSFTTPDLGTPSAATLTNATGLPIIAGTTGTLSVARGGTGVTTSTGSGNVVLSTSPTLTTPNLGTPSTLVGTNISGYASSLSIGGSAASATNAGAATNATYATSAGSATNATLATLATSATYATSAGSATNATSASSATNATYATSAGSATNAGYASSAGYATSAGSATNATYAANANVAQQAVYATSAGSASFATNASYATSGGSVVSVNGYTGAVVTSSFQALGTPSLALRLVGPPYANAAPGDLISGSELRAYGVQYVTSCCGGYWAIAFPVTLSGTWRLMGATNGGWIVVSRYS